MLALAACSSSPHRPVQPNPAVADAGASAASSLRHENESHFGAIRQLSFGGENAEAYWSFDGTRLIFQTTRPPYQCDQIMTIAADGSSEAQLVSTGKGKTTCAYFTPGDERILYASTHMADAACPPKPDRSLGYVWPLDDYDIYSARPDGSHLKRLTNRPGYDAEATVCPKDGSIIFTSTRDGDLDLYRMDANGDNVKRLTSTAGYDGGAFFSADCTQIVWRASRPTGGQLAHYQAMLAKGLFRPSVLEIFVANADGSNQRQVTNLNASSFAPYFHPNGRRILFSTSYLSKNRRAPEFDIWAINSDGTQLERITYSPGFDGFPMFSPDGTKLAFASNRNQAKHGDTDIYVADWIDNPQPATVVKRPEDRFLKNVAWLADDAREGRGLGTDGLDAAADWLEAQFRDIGLAPGTSAGFKHTFEVVASMKRGSTTAVTIAGKQVEATDFVPASFSASKSVAGRTRFVGYGIVSKQLGINDYRGNNVRGKIAVVRRFTPNIKDDRLRRQHGDLRYKAFLARERGAVGLIVLDLPAAKNQAEAPLPRLVPERRGDVGIPVVIIKRQAAASLIRRPGRVKLTVELTKTRRPTHNIVGKIVAGAGKHEGSVVIGAHYDHLGYGASGGSLEPGKRVIHNGADDNASGTAALLEVARDLAADRASLKRDVYIVAFSAEELGVIGSSQLVKHPPAGFVVKDVVAMLNMDMVGRMRRGQLNVSGAGSSHDWPAVVKPACARARVTCTLGGSGYGPSDHTPFYAAGAPVLHFFTGAHTDYHKSTDDTDKVNATGAMQTVTIVADVARQVANKASRLTYVRTKPPAPRGDARSFGASLGSIPSYAANDKPGVVLDGVVPGGAAEKAGLRRGDRIVALGGREVRTIQDLMYVLRAAKPGDTAVVAIVRGGKRVTKNVTYKESKRSRR